MELVHNTLVMDNTLVEDNIREEDNTHLSIHHSNEHLHPNERVVLLLVR
jgi:hypothetical protein